MRASVMAVLTAGLLVTSPVLAQTAASGTAQTAPVTVRDDNMAAMQAKLNALGFDAGRVDGIFGPDTAAALKRYQAKNGLDQTGEFDTKTAAMLTASAPTPTSTTGPALASSPAPIMPATTTTATAATGAAVGSLQGAASVNGAIQRNSGAAAASGDTNQAVATTSANAPVPAKGANSFSMGEAQRRIEGQGFAAVTDLKKDGDGVWRGRGTKDGAGVGVWLDYKGNVGQS